MGLPSHPSGSGSCRVASTSIIERLRGERNALVDRFAEAIVVEGGRRDGSAETRVKIDLRHPEPADGAQWRLERWRLRTAHHRLARAPFSRDVLAAFHDADAQKGRRLTAIDRRTVEKGRIGVVLDAAIALNRLNSPTWDSDAAGSGTAPGASTTSWWRDVCRSPPPGNAKGTNRSKTRLSRRR